MPLLEQLKEAIRPYYLRWIYFRLRPGRRPEAFSQCWQYPFQKLSEAVRLPESTSGLPDLLFYPMTDWHTRTQRTQHLIQTFADMGYRCLLVNPHLGREFETIPLLDKEHRLSRLQPNIFELHIRLPREPVFHHRLLAPDEEDILFSAIRRTLPHHGHVIQILSLPIWLGIVHRFRLESGFPIIYDCHDWLAGFAGMSRDIVALEGSVFQAADLVLFSSEGLLAKFRDEVPRKCLLVRNGVAAGRFQVTRSASPGPLVAGYVGALDSWFDIEAVRQSALANPKCRFILAGRVEFQSISQLKSLPNVELIGEIPYARVPDLLATFHVGMIPFKINDLTSMTNPIKLYEYFSCGLPVVTSPIPEAQSMNGLVYQAANPADFAMQITRALEEDDAPRRARRREIAVRESWSARAHIIGAEFNALLTGPPV